MKSLLVTAALSVKSLQERGCERCWAQTSTSDLSSLLTAPKEKTQDQLKFYMGDAL